MGIFDPKWLKLHRRVCDRYEKFAFKAEIEEGPPTRYRMVSVMGKVLESELSTSPEFSKVHAFDYLEAFKHFDIRDKFEFALRKNNPDIPDEGVDKIFHEVKRQLLESEYEHMSYVFFTIAMLIDEKKLEINSAEYLLKTVTNEIPESKNMIQTLKRAHRMAKMMQADEARSNSES
jgi:hypothetical protein